MLPLIDVGFAVLMQQSRCEECCRQSGSKRNLGGPRKVSPTKAALADGKDETEGKKDADGSPQKKGALKTKSALKGGRNAQAAEADGTRDVVSLLPVVFIRAALVVLHKLEGQLMTTGSLEDAFNVLKCVPPSFHAIISEMSIALQPQHSLPMLPISSAVDPTAHAGNLLHGTDLGVEAESEAIGRSASQSSGPQKQLRRLSSGAHAPSAIAQFVKALEVLDALDDTYALSESLAKDKRIMQKYPALPPNTTPETFIGTPTTTLGTAVNGSDGAAADVARGGTHGGAGGEELKSVSGSMYSAEEVAETDAVSKMIATAAVAKHAPAVDMIDTVATHLTLRLPAVAPPLCEYVLDDGRLLNAMLQPDNQTEGDEGASPTSVAQMSPNPAADAAEHVCDGKLVQIWMLPRQFRALVRV